MSVYCPICKEPTSSFNVVEVQGPHRTLYPHKTCLEELAVLIDAAKAKQGTEAPTK